MDYVERGLHVFYALRTRLGDRAFYSVLSACGILLVGGLLYTLTRPHPVALFASPLTEDQVAEIDGRLSAWGIAHDVTASGIIVEGARRDDIVVRLSMSGLPHQHVATSGETLAKLNALTPDAIFQAQSRAGLEGDLAVALRAIDGIRDASIVIAPAVTAPFSDSPASSASAAVRLTMRPGITPTQGMIDGIRAFIAGGVPGLDRSRITLLDDHGIALSAGNPAQTTVAAQSDPAATLQSAFDEAFGHGAVLARVHISYDTASHETREVRRSVLDGAALRENEHREHLHGGARNYDRVDRDNERGSITHEEVSHRAAGNTAHVTVALFVNAERRLDIERLRSLAVATVGLDLAHGDAIVVEPMPFAKEQATPITMTLTAVSLAAPYTNYFLLIGLALAGFLARVHVKRGAQVVHVRLARMQTLRLNAPADSHACEIHASLRAEPIYTAAAVLTSLPTPLRNAVLARYTIEEREALHRKMHAPVTHYAAQR